jgi:DNA-binding response OmpR family regulator
MKVLIVEDDDSIAEMYALKCELTGIGVKRGQNGLEALAILQDYQPDAVLLDLQMPEMNGEQFLAAFRDKPQFAKTPVLILTNMGEHEIPKSIYEHDIVGVIVKANCTPAEVIERIKHTIAPPPPPDQNLMQ